MSGAYGGGRKLQNKVWYDKDGVRLFVQQGLKPGEYVFKTGPRPGVEDMVELSQVQTAELIKFLKSRV